MTAPRAARASRPYVFFGGMGGTPMLRNRRRGTILITTMVVSIALAGTVIVMCRSMRVEMQASANMAAAAEAAAVERGAEQFVLALLANYRSDVRSMSEEEFAAVPVGNGYFWLLRPDFEDASLPIFGLVEEAGKLNLNDAQYVEVERLPGMTYAGASSILDWVDGDSNVERDGAENEYYLSLPEPYYCKNEDFETVEELLLVREVYRDMLYGDGTAPPLGERTSNRTSGRNLFADPQLARGIYDLVTVYSRERNRTIDGEARVNVNRINSDSRFNAFRQKLRDRLGTERGNQVADAVRASVPSINQLRLGSAFHVYFRGKLKPEEFELIFDDLTHDNDDDLSRRVNPNVAPAAVLRCMEGLTDEDVDNLIAQRAGNDPASSGMAWVADALGQQKIEQVGARFTNRSDQYSADILAVSGNGRAFKRVRIVVDTFDGVPQIVYRRDVTERGWPIDPEILASIRRGEAMASGAHNVLPTRSGGRF